MAAIEARYGMTREQLLGDQSALGLAFQRLGMEADRAREQAVSQTRDSAIERGVGRSGIVAQDLGEVERQFAQLAQQYAAQQQQQQGAISSALSRIDTQSQSEQATARTAAEAGLIGLLQNQTLQDLLASIPPAPSAPPGIVNPAPPQVGAPPVGFPPELWHLLGL
jgi:hypothetical protein